MKPTTVIFTIHLTCTFCLQYQRQANSILFLTKHICSTVLTWGEQNLPYQQQHSTTAYEDIIVGSIKTASRNINWTCFLAQNLWNTSIRIKFSIFFCSLVFSCPLTRQRNENPFISQYEYESSSLLRKI